MKRLPGQVIRLAIPFLVIAIGLLVAKHFFTPPTFGEFGHYRGAAIAENTEQQIQYAGHLVCADCHDEITTAKALSYHRGVSCEVCHGPAYSHTESPTDVQLEAPRGRGFCTLCHTYLPSRPTGFPQIIPITHNPGKPCVSCHNPHDPTPPHVPQECGACHGSIERTKLVSHHVNLQCTRCHDTPAEHKVTPRLVRAKKPANREFCGGCHAQGAESPPGIPRVDMVTHGEGYVCWDCHYPHLPQAYGGASE